MQKLPAVKFLILFILGLILGLVFKINIVLSLFLLFLSLIIILLAFRYNEFKKFYPIIVFLVGMIFVQSTQNLYFKYPDKIIPDFKAMLKGKIVKVLTEKEKYKRVLVEGTIDADIFDKINDIKVLLTVYGRGADKLKLNEGTTIRVNSNVHVPRKPILPEDFNEYNYARSAGFQFYCDAHFEEVGIISQPDIYDDLLNSVRKNIKKRIDILFNMDNAGIIKALLTGDKSYIAPETKRDFARTGTAHVLAISGLHIGIISGVILLLLGFVRLRFVKFIIFIVLLIAFVLLTGSHPSSVRAAMMAGLIYIAFLSQRQINLLNILSFAVLIIIFVRPQMIYSIGFQMSVGALLGISLFFEPFKNLFAKWIKSDNPLAGFINTSLALTFSVSVVLAPVVGFYFGYYSVVAPVANIFIVPLITLILIYALLSVLFSYIFVPLAVLFATTTDFLINNIKGINSVLSDINISPGNAVVIPFAIAVSLATLYVLYAKYARQTYFRLVASAVIITLFIFLLKPEHKEYTEVYPRQDVVFIEAVKKDKVLFIIIDRKPKSYIKDDYGLIKHINERNGDCEIIYTGKAGKSIVAKLKKSKQLRSTHVNLNNAMLLVNKLGLNYNIIQKISI